MKDTTSKEKMLKKVRKALLEKRENPHPNLEDAPLYENYDGYLDVLFAEQLSQIAGKFIFCEDEIHLAENLLILAEERKWRQIYCWEKPLMEMLTHFDFPFFESDTKFLDAEVGITSCEALIARNGSVLLSNANEAGRRLSIYPHCHVVIAHTSQLVLDLKDGLRMLKDKYGEDIPSMISVVTGPSRTADIEKTLVLGAHGPKELIVFLLDDQV